MNEDGTGLLTIGELARLTGVPVKTIRSWSDQDLLPPAARTPAGYRLYGPDAPARLEIVRSLRELGIGLTAIRSVLHRELTVAETAAQWADALDAQIRTLRLQSAVLRSVAARGSAAEQLPYMTELARLSARERRRIITDFVEDALDGVDAPPTAAVCWPPPPICPTTPPPSRSAPGSSWPPWSASRNYGRHCAGWPSTARVRHGRWGSRTPRASRTPRGRATPRPSRAPPRRRTRPRRNRRRRSRPRRGKPPPGSRS
ncbi:MerR family transcriptional regulator [Streptomyces sp. Isolate_219]|uniref:helix-turn-helix domain-containing protein n=1 Tax=Streptomyces sp. Isolate_219 TaxID=2950110 RepID=UPI0021C7E5EF|nr:MerR family transcriptional regulator [Streptomyces sp. Isolate_219]MCR8576231.1 MerR family transcriptional regulator [Streptomyces sp. Isolate_219]